MYSDRRPSNVGILAMEMYVPKRYVSQVDLEARDNCPGKYTVGLGQTNMAFVDDREDITSIFLTAVSSLLKKYEIDPRTIGRMEVGTETLIDKSKSVKTSLMALFGENSDVEGITNVNACYGGTAALFNSISWIESSEWDGRYALVVCGDIAVYEAGPARPAGGCGALAMLLGTDAPLVLEPGVRASHMMDVYDFYKPAHSEYPVVDGKLSQWAYLTSVDHCYQRYKEKYALRYPTAHRVTMDHFHYFCFHSPYNKLVQKGFSRLQYVDCLGDPENPKYASAAAYIPTASNSNSAPLQKDSYESREVDAAFRAISKARYDTCLTPSCDINKNIGNCYSGSVFSSLLGLVCKVGDGLVDKRTLMFSYGSGSAASIYSLVGRVPTNASITIPTNPNFTLARIQALVNMQERLEDRTQCSVDEFVNALDMRASTYGHAPMAPQGLINAKTMFPDTFYLVAVNDKHHRSYLRAHFNEAGELLKGDSKAIVA